MVITYPAIGRIQTLTWDIAIRVRCIVGVEPIWERQKSLNQKSRFHGAPPEPREDLPSMDKDLFRAIRGACGGGAAHIAGHLL
jgi:hypothetical protein